MQPDLQFIACVWLLIGFCGGREEQSRAINLCRRFDGTVLFQEGDVMVVEVAASPEVIDDLLARLPRGGVTHLWRSGPPAFSGRRTTRGKLNLCGI